MRRWTALGWLLLVLGVGHLGNGVWMLLDPGHWYSDLPAGVPDYGPFNEHFVRDIGCAFVTAGIALVWAAWSVRHRFPLVVAAGLFVGTHAVLHVFDTGRGVVSSDHWWLDLPSVYLPAVVLLAVAVHLRRTESSNSL